jgi:hypothetical protein
MRRVFRSRGRVLRLKWAEICLWWFDISDCKEFFFGHTTPAQVGLLRRSLVTPSDPDEGECIVF